MSIVRRELLLAVTVAVATLAITALAASPVAAADGDGADDPASDEVVVTMFVGDGCPYCAQAQAFFVGLTAAHPNLTVIEHEVWYDEAGRQLMAETAAELGATPGGVPFIILDDQWWSGYAPSIGDEIAAAVLPRLGGGSDEVALVEAGSEGDSFAGVAAAAALGVAALGGVLLVRSRVRNRPGHLEGGR